jgi:hypothetical protein
MWYLVAIACFALVAYFFAYIGTNMHCKMCHLLPGKHVHFTSPGSMIHSPNYANQNQMCEVCTAYPGEKHFHSFTL